jgi:glycosyltransferase involved in cell wall biosynthesis
MSGRLAAPAAVPLQLVRGSEPEAGRAAPLLSVVVCAYGHAAYIEECLETIDRAAAADIELLVIDDGSPDDTLRRCVEFPFRNGRAFRVYTKANQGLVHSLRSGLALARGRYVAFIASDDCYTELGLDAVLSRLGDAQPPIDALLCQAVFLSQRDGESVYGPTVQALFDRSAVDRLAAVCTEFPKPMLLQSTVFGTAFLRSLAPWCDGLELDDWPTFIRLFIAEAERGAVVRYAPDVVLCRYRVHEGGIHNRLDRQLRVTEQVARSLVPTRYRRTCLANVRIDIGLIHLYEGRWAPGLLLCLSGLLTWPNWSVVRRVSLRAGQFVLKRWRRVAKAQEEVA